MENNTQTAKLTDNAILTTDHAASSYGIPVLVISGMGDDAILTADGAYGPRDLCGDHVDGAQFTAASNVAAWVKAGGRTADELALAAKFLRSWPGCPDHRVAEAIAVCSMPLPSHSPAYTYDLNGVDDMTRKAVIYVTAKRDGAEAFALFTVDAKGNVEADTSGDNCEENPFDPEGWPEPPAAMIAEARQMASER